MKPKIDYHVAEWVAAGVIDAAEAERIRAFEAARGRGRALRWPARLALGFGALLVAAGILLFVSAHWNEMSPSARFALVLSLVASFHVGGALAGSASEPLAIALHMVGTAALGAGIFLAAQIFNLQEHWPAGVLLWAAGAWSAWLLGVGWPQALVGALLTPAWLLGEWHVRAPPLASWVSAQGTVLLALTYLGARTETDLLRLRIEADLLRRGLAWLGGFALLPAVLCMPLAGSDVSSEAEPGGALFASGLLLAYALPLALAWLLRRRAAWMNAAAAGWVGVFAALSRVPEFDNPLGYAWLAAGSAGLAAWGVRDRHRGMINLGIAGFALTTVAFYFSNVMDRLSRSLALTILGLLFLVGGYLLENVRRRLLDAARGGEAPA